MESPWYRDGLRFKCTDCGECCRGEGLVFVSPSESVNFTDREMRRLGRRVILLKMSTNDCYFLDAANSSTGRHACTVHDIRPTPCRTYPFWRLTLQSPEAWQQEARRCEGIGQGRLYNLEEIEALASGRGSTYDDAQLPSRTVDITLTPEALKALGQEAFGQEWP